MPGPPQKRGHALPPIEPTRKLPRTALRPEQRAYRISRITEREVPPIAMTCYKSGTGRISRPEWLRVCEEARDECLRDCAIVDPRSDDIRLVRGPVYGRIRKLQRARPSRG